MKTNPIKRHLRLLERLHTVAKGEEGASDCESTPADDSVAVFGGEEFVRPETHGMSKVRHRNNVSR